MTKDQLQKELLEEIKPGIKPSDLKKQNKKPISPSPISIDEGYSSEEEKNIPKVPPLPTEKIKELQNQITSLKKQLQTYKDFKEADLKIKEKYKETIKGLQTENKQLIEKISKLENQGKNTVNSKQELFNCYHCHQSHNLSLLVLELPEGKLCKSCWQVLRKKTKEQVNPTLNTSQLFTCVNCDQEKQEIPIYKKVDISYKTHLIKGKEYPVCSSCLPIIKEYNEDENRELDIDE